MEKMKVCELKKELQKVGAKVKGNKTTLIQRLNDWTVHQLNRTLFDVPILSGDKENFPPLKYELIENLQYQVLEWLTPTSINMYFDDRLAKRGHDQGRKLFMCEFLKSMKQSVTGDDVFILGVCSAEQKKSVDYEAKVHLNCQERNIIKSYCECPAGKGLNAACKHVSALLYGAEYYGVTGKVKTSGTCTDVPQQWHKPNITGPGRQLEAISVDELMGVPKCDLLCSPQVTSEYFQKCISAKIHTPLMYHRHSNLSGYFNDHQYGKFRLETFMLNNLNKVSEKERFKIEQKTRSYSKKWRDVRSTRITASIAYNVVRTCKTGKYATGFLRQHILQTKIRSSAIAWGLKNEEIALREYSGIMGETFSRCGIFVDVNMNFLSATPDGVNNSASIIVEIKCPFSNRFEKPEKASYLENGQLKKNHAYFVQVQLQMHVTKIYKCDFVVWTTKGIIIQPIIYDEGLVTEYLNHIQLYYNNVFSEFYYKLKYDSL